MVYPIERTWRGGRCEKAPIGFVASGPSYAMLCDALREMGLLGEFPILKLAISYPVDMSLVDQIAATDVDEVCARLHERKFAGADDAAADAIALGARRARGGEERATRAHPRGDRLRGAALDPQRIRGPTRRDTPRFLLLPRLPLPRFAP